MNSIQYNLLLAYNLFLREELMYKINIIEKESQIDKGDARKAMHVDCRWDE